MRRDSGAIHKPFPARLPEGVANSVERSPAPVFMIAGNAIERDPHLPEYIQRFVQVSRLLDDVSGEADRIRREPVDQGNNAYEIGTVALVVDIADMHDPK